MVIFPPSRIFWLGALIAFAVACASDGNQKGTPSKEDASPSSEVATGQSHGQSENIEFKKQVEAFYWAHLDFRPSFGVYLGHHQYDGRLPDVSPQALQAEIERLKHARTTFEATQEEGLSAVQRLERDVLLFEISESLFMFERLRTPWRSPMFYNWSISLANYISRDYKPLAQRAESVIQVAEKTPAYLAQVQQNLDPKMPKTWIETALIQIRGGVAFVEGDVKKAFADLRDEKRKVRLENALGTMAQALKGHAAFLEGRLAEASDDFRLGPELFLDMLAETQGVRIELERLEAIAQADLDRNLKAMMVAAHTLDPEKKTREVIAQVMADKPPVDGVIQEAEAQAVQMRQFLLEKKIVSIPSDDVAEVRVTPPFMRYNSAFLDSAGPFEEKKLPSFYYISPPDPSWSEADQKAYIPGKVDLLGTTIHELWPGHFLQALHAKRSPSMVLKSFGNYAFSEGWAHYVEEMMFNQGVGDGDPRVHIGQLTNALLRNVRFVSALGLHARTLTVEESEKLFSEKAFQDPGNARQQARRGTFDPMYLSYTLGKLMIIKLREDWKKKVGEAYSIGAFHDAFLSHGEAPIPVIRKAMLGADAGPPL
jgi:uncharacterized protein (DUF885 family)